MQNFDFNLIRYRHPRPHVHSRLLSNIIGIDSEAYTDGIPFMFTTSLGEAILPTEWPECLGRRAYRSANFVVWNLRYDSGAFLHHLPSRHIDALRLVGEVSYRGWKYRYFPHKFLRISKGRSRATFWDIQPFYESTLDEAAREHLKQGKLDVGTKRFNRAYVRKHWHKICRYGVRDAELVKGLAVHLIDGLKNFDIDVTALYSQASISQRYFTREAGVVDVWKHWRGRRLALQFACEAYWGGKFESTRRGKFNGYQYDVKSAYPYEMSRLIDVREAQVTRGKLRPDSAIYGYARVHLRISPSVKHSIPVRVRSVSIFPSGSFEATVTVAELEDLRQQGVDITPLDGFWLTVRTKHRPYEKVIKHLWRMKEGAGRAHPWIKRLAKKLANSYYGKLVQLTRDIVTEDKHAYAKALIKGKEYKGSLRQYLRAGPCWNPFYGAIITANTRLRVTQAQRSLGQSSIAVHTDSILSTEKLPKPWLGSELGDWALQREGEGLLICSGVYDMADKIAFRGLKVRDGKSWRERLAGVNGATSIEVPVLVVPSLLGAVSRGNRSEANVFFKRIKHVKLNSDVKRIWDVQATSTSLLRGLRGSSPQVIIR